ncbi:uncharacterized protein LOC6035050 isoform X2 [Culex quinquefasciatus]|uniref:uncharacterized protein LOC6035050 isoform X2 n=1 Tax=Culex quinquefasciatus TaxID=7176 RepID=UPI0018E310D5|nr:uncharacterized protein LOC6035050 isoform X2 [Culex quinquefasciatus]
MSEETTIDDLPEEMLETIFSHLDLEDRKSVTAVCHRWSRLALRWSELQLEVDFRKCGTEESYRRTLLDSQRPYRHLVCYFGYDYAVGDLLLYILAKFSESLETMKLIPNQFVPVELSFFASLTKLSANLKKLHIDACNFRDNSDGELEFHPLNNLQDLYLENNLLDLSGGHEIRELTPNISALHVQISYYSDRPLHVLRHFGPRLKELEVWFLSEDRFLEDGDTIQMVQQFFRKSPELREATLRCNMIEPILADLANSCKNLRFLCLSMETVSADCFRWFSSLQNLKSLRLEDATIESPNLEQCPTLSSLRKISLYSVKITNALDLNHFLCRSYPALSVLELINVTTCGSFLYDQVVLSCNMAQLERLVLIEPDKSINLMLFEYIDLPKLREVKLKFKESFLASISVGKQLRIQYVTIELSVVNVDTFQNIRLVLPNLKRLTLSGCSRNDFQTAREIITGCDVRYRRKWRFEEAL